MTKKPYASPQVRAHGKLEDLTHGASSGTSTDAAFPVNTNIADFTFT